MRFVSLLAGGLLSAALYGQSPAGSMSGQVIDPSGASVPGALVAVKGRTDGLKETKTDDEGKFSVPQLLPGRYTVRVSAAGFTPFEARNVPVVAGQASTLMINLAIQSDKQTVTVDDLGSVSTDPSSNVGAIVLRGEDLNILSDNPDDLSSDLQALAGPSAGPNGGEIFVDGFSGGKLPPKSSIREIRVNSNPFSAEYDRLGFGRIEIFTKPGTDKLRGMVNFNFGDEIFNSRNPFAPNRPPYQLRNYGGNLGGALGKKASFFLDVERREVDGNAVFNGTILNSSLLPTPFSAAYVTPTRITDINPRIDYALNNNNTLVVRYGYGFSEASNQGLGTFSLADRAFTTNDNDHSLQVTETAILSPSTINEVRFQYRRSNTRQDGSLAPTVAVLEAFTSGGSQVGNASNLRSTYELANILSTNKGRHFLKYGGRMRYGSTNDYSPNNFGGTFTFTGGNGPILDASNNPVMGTNGVPTTGFITSIERYRRTLLFQQLGYSAAQIRSLGGGASQFTISAGSPLATVGQWDLGIFFDDSFRFRPNLTLNFGVRYETQNNISDYKNIAPRIALAWNVDSKNGQAGKTILRAGFGMFYDRINDNLTLQTRRFNGVTQQQYFVLNPDFFPAIPNLNAFSGNTVTPTQRVLYTGIENPYVAQLVIGVDRQLPKNTQFSSNFVMGRGINALRTRNINTPFGGPAGPRPFGNIGNIYLYEATGLYDQKQWMTNFSTRFHPTVTMFGYYAYGHARGNADNNVGSFPADAYDMTDEYGRNAFDIRHRFLTGGNIRIKQLKDVTLNPFIIAQTGGPFNITTGRDNNNDSIFNDRPSLAVAGATGSNIITTNYGTFNITPAAGERLIARNLGNGPGLWNVNMRLSKTWGFGKETGGSASVNQGNMTMGPPGMGGGPGMGRGGPGGGGRGGMFAANSGRQYSLTFSVQARNLLNHVNPGAPIGNLTSPLFGLSNQNGGGFGGGPGGGGPGGGGGGGGRGFGFGGGSSGNRSMEFSLRLSF